MVESLKELNQKVQKPNYKKVGNWMVRHIERDLALYITWALLHTKITANQVTFFSIIVGLLSALAFCFPIPGGFLTGVLLLQFWYLLDHVDGQIARYRETASLTGVYFDYITHYVVHSFLFIGLGIGAYLSHGMTGMLLLGIIAALFMAFLSMFYDAKWKAFYHWFQFLKIERAEFKWPEIKTADDAKEKSSFLKSAFVFLCKLSEIHVIMNILTVLAVIGLFRFDFIFGGFDLTIPEFITLFYASLLPFIFIIRTAHAVMKQTLDKEFNELVNRNA